MLSEQESFTAKTGAAKRLFFCEKIGGLVVGAKGTSLNLIRFF